MPQPSPLTPLGIPFIELQFIDSTNIYAYNQVHAGLAQHGKAFFAHNQVAGKGQRGKIWISENGANINLSVVIKPDVSINSAQFQLSACTAVAMHHFFSGYAGNETKIKWPNDLYWQDRKAGGVLIESVVRSSESGVGKWEWGIIGIGININQTSFPPNLNNPVSLKQITGKNFHPVLLAKELCTILDGFYRQLINEGFEKVYTAYLSHLYKKNDVVKLKKESRVFEAVIKTVTPSGQLIIQHAIEETIEFGEIEWLL